MSSHHEVVTQISIGVREYFHRKQSFRIFHGSTNSTRPNSHGAIMDISKLSNILEIDEASRLVTVEPNVSMDRLVRATLAHNLIPPVVMEFPGITVGGGYAGSAGESSSLKYGYSDQTVTEVEIVLASGDVVTASEYKHPDLFRATAGSMGTFGITTKLQMKLIPAKRFVKLTYHTFKSTHETVVALREATEDPANDFLDGILFSDVLGVLMTGQLTDEKPAGAKAQCFSAPKDPWFYLHVRKQTERQISVDYIPIAEYLFRYDRGGFWVAEVAFKYLGFVPFNRITRWLLDDLLHTRVMYRALHGSNLSFKHIIQDLSLPYHTVETFIEYVSNSLHIWPLWLCPLGAVHPPTFHPFCIDKGSNLSPQPMLNVGVCGAASRDLDISVRQNRELEAHVAELGGRKVLYSHTYYTPDEFWQLYDQKSYDMIRAKYGANTLPTVYDKVNVDVKHWKQLYSSTWTGRLATSWPLAGLIGTWHALRSGDWLLHRDRNWMKWKLDEGD